MEYRTDPRTGTEYTPADPRMTVLLSFIGFQAKPTRGCTLPKYVCRRLCGRPASEGVTNGVFPTAIFHCGLIRLKSCATIRPPGKFRSKFPSCFVSSSKPGLTSYRRPRLKVRLRAIFQSS